VEIRDAPAASTRIGNSNQLNHTQELKEVQLLSQLFLFMAPSGQEGGAGIVGNVVLFGSIILIFYFMIIRPQQKRQKERQQMVDSMKKGDKIVTAGGIHGTIVGIEDKTALVQIADNVKVKVDRSTIGTILKEGEPTTK
jgi:preprotein translocase subunit YajC